MIDVGCIKLESNSKRESINEQYLTNEKWRHQRGGMHYLSSSAPTLCKLIWIFQKICLPVGNTPQICLAVRHSNVVLKEYLFNKLLFVFLCSGHNSMYKRSTITILNSILEATSIVHRFQKYSSLFMAGNLKISQHFSRTTSKCVAKGPCLIVRHCQYVHCRAAAGKVAMKSILHHHTHH